VAEPIIIARTMCFSELITFPFTDATFKKDNFGLLVVFIDFLVILSILLYIYIIGARQDEFINAFKEETI
jgi:hypothetical protein